jgi:hypothetical protein
VLLNFQQDQERRRVGLETARLELGREWDTGDTGARVRELVCSRYSASVLPSLEQKCDRPPSPVDDGRWLMGLDPGGRFGLADGATKTQPAFFPAKHLAPMRPV